MQFLSEIWNSMPGILSQGMIWGVMAIGVYITYKVLDIADLTVDGSFSTGGATCIMMMLGGHNVWISMFVAVLAGMLAGMVTGIFHTLMGIPAILAGILTQLGLYSVNLMIMDKKANQGLFTKNKFVSALTLNDTNLKMILVVLILITILYLFFGTELGSGIRATGSNQNMSRAQGINTRLNIVIGLMLSNGIVAFSGALLAQYNSSADVQMGRGAIVIGLAAVIIGEVLLGKILHNFGLRLLTVVIGSIVYYLFYTVVINLNIDTNYLKLLTALLVALFLAIPYWKSKFARPIRKKTTPADQKGDL